MEGYELIIKVIKTLSEHVGAEVEEYLSESPDEVKELLEFGPSNTPKYCSVFQGSGTWWFQSGYGILTLNFNQREEERAGDKYLTLFCTDSRLEEKEFSQVLAYEDVQFEMERGDGGVSTISKIYALFSKLNREKNLIEFELKDVSRNYVQEKVIGKASYDIDQFYASKETGATLIDKSDTRNK